MKKVDLKISLLLSFVCLIAGLFVLPYQMETLQTVLPNMNVPLPIPFGALLIISSLQLAVMSFLLAFLGIKLARKTGFLFPILDSLFHKSKVKIDKTGLIYSVVAGLVVALVLSGSDRFYFQHKIEIMSGHQPEFSFFGLMAGVLYGGVFEEIFLRLFFMSLLMWIFMKLFRQSKEKISSVFYWVAIVIAAVLFAAGHLPANEMIFGDLTTVVIVRCFLLNGVGGLLFGYLYWKKGFEYAVFAHMFAHIFMQLIFNPLFY